MRIFPSDTEAVFAAAGGSGRELHWIRGVKHGFDGQPELPAEAFDGITEWLRQRKMGA